jgi:hypothetical protein
MAITAVTGNGDNGDNGDTDRRALTSLNVSNSKLGVLATEDGWTSADGDNGAPWVHPAGFSQIEEPDGLKPFGFIAIANAIPDMGAPSSANLLGNHIPVEQAQELVKIMRANNRSRLRLTRLQLTAYRLQPYPWERVCGASSLATAGSTGRLWR